jgi:hypothetical protein
MLGRLLLVAFAAATQNNILESLGCADGNDGHLIGPPHRPAFSRGPQLAEV